MSEIQNAKSMTGSCYALMPHVHTHNGENITSVKKVRFEEENTIRKNVTNNSEILEKKNPPANHLLSPSMFRVCMDVCIYRCMSAREHTNTLTQTKSL